MKTKRTIGLSLRFVRLQMIRPKQIGFDHKGK